jgi:hypothetical protein
LSTLVTVDFRFFSQKTFCEEFCDVVPEEMPRFPV